MISSLLVITPPENLKFEDLGPTICDSLERAELLLSQHRFGVVVIFSTDPSPQATLDLIQKRLGEDSHLIICATHWSVASWIEVTSQVRCDAVFRSFANEGAIRDSLNRALEVWQRERQDADFIHMVSESNLRLAADQVELQDRVARRQKSLARSLARLQNTIKYFEALKASFVAVHQARSLKEMEDLLLGAIVPSIPLSSLHLRYASQTSLPQSLASHEIKGTESLPLMIGEVKIGDLVVIPAERLPLDSAQRNFLTRVAEAATLGLDRLAKLEQAETVKQEWETTFDAISEPLCLTDLQFRIIKTNKAFSHEAKQSFRSLLGQNCFSAFFKSQDVPHHLAETDLKFRRDSVIKGHSRTFEISIQASPIEVQDQEVILVLMRDITSRLVLERKIVESSKQAELGLIGSSIAHELNNPLGGMLSFVQLIRMDLNDKSPFWGDVKEMESAAHRCKEIVQNLLGFARRSDSTERIPVEVNEIIMQAIRITELKSRPQGIPIHFAESHESMLVCGQANQLTQALCNLLQNSVEAVLARRHQSSRDRGNINITAEQRDKQIIIEITDTGIGFDATLSTKIFNPLFTTKSPVQNPGLGLTVARRILSDHHGHLEISSQTGVGTKAVIALPMAERPAQSRDFDSKI